MKKLSAFAKAGWAALILLLIIGSALIGSVMEEDGYGNRIGYDENGNRTLIDTAEKIDESALWNKWPYLWPSWEPSDWEDNFQNYATGKSRIVLPDRANEENAQVCNVVGVILDKEAESIIFTYGAYTSNALFNDRYLRDAAVCIDGEITVYTDALGRFQITNLPNGKHSFEISAPGYQNAVYANYRADGGSGASIFMFFIDKGQSIYDNYEDLFIGEQTIPPDRSFDEHETTVIDREVEESRHQSHSNRMPNLPYVENTVYVYYNGSTSSVARSAYFLYGN